MRACRLLAVGSLWLCISLPTTLSAQTAGSGTPNHNRYTVFGGYSFLSNSFNDWSFPAASHVPLNGWDAGIAFRAWHHLDDTSWHRLGVKVDASGYYGTSLGSPQTSFFVLAGPQYTWTFGKNRPFIEGQAGFGHLNSEWFSSDSSGNTNNSFAAFGGGGLDREITPRLALRVEGGLLYTNFTIGSAEIHGLPNYFARISTGLVWPF